MNRIFCRWLKPCISLPFLASSRERRTSSSSPSPTSLAKTLVCLLLQTTLLVASILWFACSGDGNNNTNTNNNTNNTNGCTSEKDCPVEQTCDNAKCRAIVCTQDQDCRNGYVCNVNTQRCNLPPECPEKDKGGCCKDEHCPSGKVCKNKTCETKPPDPCKENSDCKAPENPKCVEGGCHSITFCKENKDCQDSALPSCQSGTCSASPLAKLNEACDKVACDKDLLCFADIGTPFCKTPCDPFNAICPTGTVCAYVGQNKGVCRERNNGKREGDICTSNPCERNLFCVDWPSGSSTCAKPCRPTQSDCTDKELCYDFGNVHLCVPKPPQCGPGRPCDGTSWACDDKLNYCLPDQCPKKSCPTGQLCRLGNCEPPNCCRGDVCPSGYVCNHNSGSCIELALRVPFCTSCLGSGTCASAGQRCLKLSDDKDTFCADECTASRKCADTDYECREQSDKRWFCIPRAGTCQRNACQGITCKEKEFCYPATKQCITVGLDLCQACTLDIQCGGPTDRCIIPTGQSSGFCGIDCSGCSVCPAGYSCKDVGSLKQCIPTSGSCPPPQP